jgi:peroxiredoxin
MVMSPRIHTCQRYWKEVQLSDYLKKGPVVLTWYRGGWCPYCNMTLLYLQEQLPNIQLKGLVYWL